jgi:hypothetical protein
MTRRIRRLTPNTQNAFTETTWETVGHTYGRDHGDHAGHIGWAAEHDLSVPLFNTVEHWDYESAASSVEAAGSGLPVRIVWTEKFGAQVEVHDGYAIIDYVVYSAKPALVRLRLRYLGFSHYVYASQVRTVEQVGVSVSYEPAPVEAG